MDLMFVVRYRGADVENALISSFSKALLIACETRKLQIFCKIAGWFGNGSHASD